MEPIPLSGAQTLHPNDQKKDFPQPDYSNAKKEYILYRRARMIAARDVRDTTHDEFDGMTFLKWWDVQKKADDQYLAPRKNKQDTSINTGTIRDKDTTLVEYANKYDFEPIAQCFDDSDEMLEDMAETMEDMVRKSLTLEDFQSKAKLIYRSMVAFGVAMVQDIFVERWVLEKTMKQGYDSTLGSSKAEWTERLKKQYDGCQAKLWDLRKIYFGDIRKFFLNGPQGQPFMFTVEYESYETVKQIFGNWDMWKYVPTNIVLSPEVSNATMYSGAWTLRPITMNYCELIWYYDPIANEIALTINGIDMLPIMERDTTLQGVKKTMISGYPLTEVSPSGAINFAKYDLEPMHDFAYSKSQPAKMRVWGDVENMFVKLMIGMLKQKAKPTLGNKSGRVFGEEVTDPATVINDIREGDLFPVLPNYEGPSQSDFSMYEMVKKELDKNSVERSFQGMDNPQPQDDTATKSMNDMKAQSLKMASMFDGIISGNKQLFWLRTFNIIKNWTKPTDSRLDQERKNIVESYRTITLPTEVEGGQKATKKIVMTKDLKMSSYDVHAEEAKYSEKKGGEMRIAYLNPEVLRSIALKWFYSCVPVPNGSDPLAYMMFAKQINDATTFFGPDSLNVKKLKHLFAAKTGNDFDTWFLGEQELQQKQQAAQGQPGQGAPVGIPGQKPGGNPTIAGAASGANPMAKMAGVMK